jgi:hypothetical protein
MSSTFSTPRRTTAEPRCSSLWDEVVRKIKKKPSLAGDIRKFNISGRWFIEREGLGGIEYMNT